MWHPLHCLHSSCPQATHMTFFLLRLKVSRPPNLPGNRSSSLALHMIEASMPSSHSAAPIMCNGQRSGFTIRILLARAPDISSLGAVPFASEEKLAPLRVLRYTHCSILSDKKTRCCSPARIEKGEMLSCSPLSQCCANPRTGQRALTASHPLWNMFSVLVVVAAQVCQQ